MAARGVACDEPSVLLFCRRRSSTELSRLKETGAKEREDDTAGGVAGVAAVAATRGASVETGCLATVNALVLAAPPPAELRGSWEVINWDGFDALCGAGFGVGGARSQCGLKGTCAGASVPPAGGSILAAFALYCCYSSAPVSSHRLPMAISIDSGVLKELNVRRRAPSLSENGL